MKLRFSIRDLLWLTVVVALAVGWWCDHKTNQQQRLSDRSKIEKLTRDRGDAEKAARKMEDYVREMNAAYVKAINEGRRLRPEDLDVLEPKTGPATMRDGRTKDVRQ